MKLPSSLENLVHSLSSLPGIGPKSAQRMALRMTNWDIEKLNLIAENIKGISSLGHCQECGFFSEKDLCDICDHKERRDQDQLCVVESSLDLIAIEKSGQYKGLYHILGGLLNPLLGVGPEQLNLDSLVYKLENVAYKSVILALNPTIEGDSTCSYLQMTYPGHSYERIGFGMPMGSSFEHMDPLTISKAFENKKSSF